MLEDTDIASTFTIPALKVAEENPILEQVPQPSERAQLSERDQTEIETHDGASSSASLSKKGKDPPE